MIPYRASLRSDPASRGLSEPPDPLARNRWTICPGPAGRFGSEQVDELDRNEWTLSSGPGGRFHRNRHLISFDRHADAVDVGEERRSVLSEVRDKGTPVDLVERVC